MNKVCKAEELLGSALFRQIQNRLPEGGKLLIPPKHREPVAFHWPTPKKTERNATICRLVLGGEMTRSEAARSFGLNRSRITVILRESDKWLNEAET